MLIIGNGGAAGRPASPWGLPPADGGPARRGHPPGPAAPGGPGQPCGHQRHPLGMEGFPPFASLSFLDALPLGAAVFDLVYHPRQTALLAAARDRGLTAIGGMELLVQQAILAFSRFTGTALDREAVRRDLLAMVEKA
ncbi:MAG: hypothetical protein ACLR5H_05225 [Oscillospiraceae bacterium]